MRKKEFTKEQINDIINKYQNNQTQKNIAEEFNVSRSVIKRILEEEKVKIRNTTPKYIADYNIFENIDNKEKAYWLGFIAADGCNYTRENNSSIIINISEKDIGHLEKFKEFCNTNAKITKHTQYKGYSKNSLMCKIVLNSKKMSQDLIDKGVVPRKSLILKPPKIDKEFYLPFILGYFDGDGSIYKTNQNNYGISIEGTKEILEWINNQLNITNKLEKRYNNSKNNYCIRCGGTKKVYNIMNKLYSSSPVCLDRKYKIYKTLETVVLSRNTK